MWPADLPACFHLVLSPDAKRLPKGNPVPRGRAVLLHGWHQSHRCWLRTGAVLRDELGLEVLLLDFYNHGESPTLADYRLHCAELLCRQVRALVVHLGWDEGRFALAGCSLGGAVSLHYFSRWPENVSNLVLVAAAGLDEPVWVPSKPLASLWKNMFMGEPPTHGRGQEPGEDDEEAREVSADLSPGSMHETTQLVEFPSLGSAPRTSLSHFLLSRLSFPTTYPTYRVPSDIITRLTQAGIPVAVYTAGLDVLHTPQLDAWRNIPGVFIRHIPWMDHTVICTSISRLRLWRRPEFWLENVVPAARL